MKLLLYLYRQSRAVVLLATLSCVVTGITGAALVGTIGQGITAGGAGLPVLASAYFALCLVDVACKSASEIALLRATQAALCRMRIEIGRKLLVTPYKTLQELGKPGLHVILTKDIDAVSAAFQLLPRALGSVVVVAACLSYLAWLSWQVFVVYLVCFVVGIVGFSLAERGPVRAFARVRALMDRLSGHVRDLIEGSRELQLNARRGAHFVDRVMAPEVESLRVDFGRAMTRYTVVNNVGMALFYVIIGLSLFLVPQWMPQSLQVLVTSTLILMYLIRPVSDMTTIVPNLRQACLSFERIAVLDAALRPVQPAPASDAAPAGPVLLELRGVRHRYPGPTGEQFFTLGPIDLTIPAGECLFVVGGNGSGKSTLAMLLLGLYTPEAGQLVFDGRMVGEGNLAEYRRHFSAVFADFHLFRHVLDDADEHLAAKGAAYIEKFGLSHRVRIENGMFSTRDLSSGQRKRLALVVAYLEDRPVYLFDEWAADQDPAFKRVFYTELLPELKGRGKTVIAITHDEEYFACADRIVKLSEGRVQAVLDGRTADLPAALRVA